MIENHNTHSKTHPQLPKNSRRSPLWPSLFNAAIFLCVLCGFQLQPQAPPPHDFHVSITQIDYKAETKSLELTVKIFTDDLEEALEIIGAPKLHLGAENEHEKTENYLDRYIADRLHLKVNGEERAFKYLGKEVELDATWCYLEMTELHFFDKIELTNRLLLEVFDDQMNIVHIKKGSEKKSLMLRKGFVKDVAYF